MKWDKFYENVRDHMVVESQYLHLLYGKKPEVELQLSRWTKTKKIHQLKRGYYILDQKYRRIGIFEPYIASLCGKNEHALHNEGNRAAAGNTRRGLKMKDELLATTP